MARRVVAGDSELVASRGLAPPSTPRCKSRVGEAFVDYLDIL